jgi:hypothetical protein
MPLLIKTDPVTAHAKPAIFCDHCGREITKAHDGNYQWQMGDTAGEGPAQVYFTHKCCCAAFEGDDPDWGAMDLECLPVFLANNLHVNWEKANHHGERHRHPGP